MAASPTVARWELSRRLGTRRRDLGLDVKTIAGFLGFTRNYWSAVENDKTLIAEDKLRSAFEILQLDEPDRSELLELREASRKRGWWESYDDVLSEQGRRLVGYEHGASSLRTFQSLVIPGLLQIEEYTRQVIGHDPLFALRADRVVEVRRRRQRLVGGANGVPFTAIMSEAAIVQQWASSDIQRRQLSYLLQAAEENPGIEIRILPFDSPPGVLVASATLVLLTFSSDHLPSVAWQESMGPVGVVEASEEVFKRLEMGWVDALDRCLSSDESLAFIDAHL